MNKKKLFLASSSELEADRRQFEIFLSRRNKDWVDKDVFLELVIWEDFLDAVSQTRLQDEYNQAIRGCDIFVMLFFTKVGTYTEEEFKTAFGQFKATNKPFIFTYFKDAQFNSALPWYEEALGIYRHLADATPQTYLPDVAMTLNNLSNLQKAKNEFPAAQAACDEALRIYRRLADANPQTYLPSVATTLNNLANLQKAKNEFPAAQAAYDEALEIRRRLADAHPQTYLPAVATTTVNMSHFYLQALPDREKSLALAREALVAALPFVKVLPAAKNYVRTALQVVKAWGLDTKTFYEETIQSLRGNEE